VRELTVFPETPSCIKGGQLLKRGEGKGEEGRGGRREEGEKRGGEGGSTSFALGRKKKSRRLCG